TKEEGAWLPCIKISSNPAKATDPGFKRLVRYFDDAGRPLGDVAYDARENMVPGGVIAGRDRLQPHRAVQLAHSSRGEDLLHTVFEGGTRIQPAEPIAAIRERAVEGMATLPDEFKRLR